MKMKIGIVNVNLEYKIPKDYKGTDEEFLENVELPKEYVEESFEIVKIVEEEMNKQYKCFYCESIFKEVYIREILMDDKQECPICKQENTLQRYEEN